MDCRASRVPASLEAAVPCGETTPSQPAASLSGPATMSMLGGCFTLGVEATADCKDRSYVFRRATPMQANHAGVTCTAQLNHM